MAEFETGPEKLSDAEKQSLQERIDASEVIYHGRVTRYGIFQLVGRKEDGSLPQVYEGSWRDDFGGVAGTSIFSTELLERIRQGVSLSELRVILDHSSRPATVNYAIERGRVAALDLAKLRVVNPGELIRERFVDENGLLRAREPSGYTWQPARSARVSPTLSGRQVIYLALLSPRIGIEGVSTRDAVVIDPQTSSLIPRVIVNRS